MTQRSLPSLLCFLILVVAACTGSSDTTTPVSSSSSTLSSTTTIATSALPDTTTTSTAPREGALLGFSTGLSRAEREPRWRQIEEDAGRSYDIGHVFHSWETAIPTSDDLMHLEDGRTLMISWNGTDTKEIAAGQHDEWIRTQAEAVRDLEADVLLRWLWEMDGNRRRDWVHSGPDYVAAWNHIRDLFADVGADNAAFVWCPNEFLFWDGGDPESWYPGDDRVDWLCADGYNWADNAAAANWLDLEDIFGDFYAWAEPRGLPIVIGETGVGEGNPGDKAAWIRAIPETLEQRLPEIDAIVYFDKDFSDRGHRDWRVDTSAETYDAWLEVSRSSWLSP